RAPTCGLCTRYRPWVCTVIARSTPTRSPKHLDGARPTDVAVARDQWEIHCARRGADQRVERVAVESHLVGEKQLLRRQIERMIDRIAEQIVEELADRPAQVDASRSREQTQFPNHCDRHVEERLSLLAAFVEGSRSWTQLAAARSVKQEGVGLGDRGLRIGHDASLSGV